MAKEQRTVMPSILVSGPVKGQHAALFKSIAKAQKKGSFAAVLCVGEFLGETKEAPADSAPVPVYVVTGSDAIDADLASRLAAKNMRWLGRSGCEDVAGLRVGFLGGTYKEETYESTAPDDQSDAAHYTCDDLEQLAIDTGAYRNDGGCDILLTSDVPQGCGAALSADDPRRAQIGTTSKPLGEAMRSVRASYHFVAAAQEGWSLEPYRCGVGGHRRLTRLHALPSIGQKRALRAFTVEPFDSNPDIDTEEGARAASIRAGELRAATANPYVVADAAASHKPPPGIRNVPMAASMAQEEDEAAAAVVLADAAPPPDEDVQVVASFPTAFGGRGSRTKNETMVVNQPARPVYTASNRPRPEAPWQPKEKKQKRVSIYANQNGGVANPKKGKRKRMGAPHGPHF